MDEEQIIRNELFKKYREDVLNRQLSNTENYDKAVLSLGTTFLGFSLAFLKDFVSYKDAIYAPLLPTSWVLFCLSIIATIASFFISKIGLSTQLQYAEKYYLENNLSYLTKKNHAAALTDTANYFSALSFILAVITTIIFVVINLVNGVNMSEKKTNGIATLDGASIPSMQSFGGFGLATLGAEIPVMQLAPVTAPPVTTQPVSSLQSGSNLQSSVGTINGGLEYTR
ncbi:hypothetical protein [Methylobacter psychrophilus]|uniref:hypothetical protein n=1 Tax=Methylobacter psychrophilus TaxID=96941 RepID=UPI0021D4C0C5|nr:hypothetical protein [Methylobacter psychrophilus]